MHPHPEPDSELLRQVVADPRVLAQASREMQALRLQIRSERIASATKIQMHLASHPVGPSGAPGHRVLLPRITLAAAAIVFCVGIGLAANLPDRHAPALSGESAATRMRITDTVDSGRPMAAGQGIKSQRVVSLAESISRVPEGGNVEIYTGSINETLSITRPVRLVAVGGHVVIGKIN